MCRNSLLRMRVLAPSAPVRLPTASVAFAGPAARSVRPPAIEESNRQGGPDMTPTTQTRQNVHTLVTERIIAASKAGVRAWLKPWSAQQVATRITRCGTTACRTAASTCVDTTRTAG
jgi:hypothetical protein